MYQVFDWLTVAALRRNPRSRAVVRWVALLLVGTGLVVAVGRGSVVGSVVLGVLAVCALVVVMKGVYDAAVERHLTDE